MNIKKHKCICGKKDCNPKHKHVFMNDCYSEKAIRIGGDVSKGIRKALEEYKEKK